MDPMCSGFYMILMSFDITLIGFFFMISNADIDLSLNLGMNMILNVSIYTTTNVGQPGPQLEAQSLPKSKKIVPKSNKIGIKTLMKILTDFWLIFV